MPLPKYPFFNMQQLNLDWLLERMGRVPETVKILALVDDFDPSDLGTAIDQHADEIPKGACFLQIGSIDDQANRTGFALIWKNDDDNICVMILSQSFNMGGFYVLGKQNGSWWYM